MIQFSYLSSMFQFAPLLQHVCHFSFCHTITTFFVVISPRLSQCRLTRIVPDWVLTNVKHMLLTIIWMHYENENWLPPNSKFNYDNSLILLSTTQSFSFTPSDTTHKHKDTHTHRHTRTHTRTHINKKKDLKSTSSYSITTLNFSWF